MKKMGQLKVYSNYLRGENCGGSRGGMIIVAAHSKDEAIWLYKHTDIFKDYFSECCDDDGNYIFDPMLRETKEVGYQDQEWRELKGVYAIGEPRVIDEDSAF